jgi:hypothetical protein
MKHEMKYKREHCMIKMLHAAREEVQAQPNYLPAPVTTSGQNLIPISDYLRAPLGLRPEVRRERIAEALGRALAQYASNGVFPLGWYGDNVLVEKRDDSIELRLIDEHTATTTTEGRMLELIRSARPELTKPKHYNAFLAAYATAKNRNAKEQQVGAAS